MPQYISLEAAIINPAQAYPNKQPFQDGQMAPSLHSSSPTVVDLLVTRQNQVANKNGGKSSKHPALSSGMSQRETNTPIEHISFTPLGQHHTANDRKRAGLLREEKQAILAGQLRYSPNRKRVPTRKVL